jgi:hypothetical protein
MEKMQVLVSNHLANELDDDGILSVRVLSLAMLKES